MAVNRVVVIGGGVAGMEAASDLASFGMAVTLLEKSPDLGGHVRNWDNLFPNRRPGKEVLDQLNKGLEKNVDVRVNATVTEIEKQNGGFIIRLEDGSVYKASAILLSTGFDLFEARKKEEYGYGIYENVITSADLEHMFATGELKTQHGKAPGRIGFVHCVGSRDEKAGNLYCSKVCCVTAVKQAIEIREKFPEAEVFCFYMDLRMFGMGFEELYKEAQEKWGIQFIRGRLSEAFENQDGSVLLKVEDTLAGRPLKMSVDLLVLMVGFEPSAGTLRLAKLLNLSLDDGNFLKPVDRHMKYNLSNIPGIFLAGACTSPKSVSDSISDARSAALKIAQYLQNSQVAVREI